MFRLFVKRNGKVIMEYYRDGNTEAYYKFSQLFHDAEVCRSYRLTFKTYKVEMLLKRFKMLYTAFLLST